MKFVSKILNINYSFVTETIRQSRQSGPGYKMYLRNIYSNFKIRKSERK